MKIIFFKKKFCSDIRNGIKTQTIRTKTILKPNDICKINISQKEKMYLKIINIYTKTFSQITEKDAKLDGFISKKELKKELKNIYKNEYKKTPLYLIQFNYLPFLSLSMML